MQPAAHLPIESVIPEVRDALRRGRSAVITAPPGSGKTTIVPLRLLGEPWLVDRKIVVLEPRRLATRAAARWMAHLVGEQVGRSIGYVTRTDRRVSSETRIEVITEGVLTRRLQRDPELPDTAAVIFDEFHERNLQTDLGLALALDARKVVRPDLRIVVMSATLDAGSVAHLIGDSEPAPVINGEARLHPVDVHWVPPRRNTRLEAHMAAVVQQAVRSEDGDVLAFLPGMGEMRRVERALLDSSVEADVRLLHGSLPLAEQDAAINPSPSGRRRIVLATDIAESSLTVEGIRVVVDSGLARKPRFDARTGMTRLRIGSISRASADQRAGRAGRIEPGVAFRLWSKVEHAGRRPHITPEIAEVDLAGFALELAAWGANPHDLVFLDPPPQRTYREAVALLRQLGALDTEDQLTISGGFMAKLPLHPRLARMVVDAGPDGMLASIVAAVLEDRDPLRGHPDEVPVDLRLRVELIADRERRHPQASGPALARTRETAHDLARRAGLEWGRCDAGRVGRILALAYPDRLALRRGSPGRFQLRTGGTAWMNDRDPLASTQFLVVADLDGKRKNARIRLAAAIDADDVAASFADDVDRRERLEWDGDRLLLRTEERLGGLVLRSWERRPEAGRATAAVLVRRLQDRNLADLLWTDTARVLAARVAYLNRTLGEPWPDWSEEALAETVGAWMADPLAAATGVDDLQRVDVGKLLRRSLDHRLVRELDRLAPPNVRVPSGRAIPVDYSQETPTVSVRVQELYGSDDTPSVAGQPVRLELLSPARRPIQVTRDLGGFWRGSWREVRKEMAGRYPKHDWPEDPATARPSRG